MTDAELSAMEKGWRDASPGTLRPWVAALLEEVRRLRALTAELAEELKGLSTAAYRQGLADAARVVQAEQCDGEACGHQACIALENVERAIREAARKVSTQ